MKDYEQIIAGVYQDLIKNTTNDESFLYDSMNKIITWLVGLSTASLGLLFAYFDNVIVIDRLTLKVIVTLFLLSIIAALISRIFHFWVVRNNRYKMTLFSVALQQYILPAKGRELSGKETCETIYKILQEDYGVRDESLLELVKLGIHKTDLEADAFSREYYMQIAKADAENYKTAVEAVTALMRVYMKIPPKRLSKYSNLKFKLNNRILSLVVDLAYISTIIFFVSALVVFTRALFSLW